MGDDRVHVVVFFTGAIGERRMMDVGFSKIIEQRL